MDTRRKKLPGPVEDDRGTPLHVGDRVRFGPFQLTIVAVPDRGEFAADLGASNRASAVTGVLARSGNGELFRFDAPALHLHRVATQAVALAS